MRIGHSRTWDSVNRGAVAVVVAAVGACAPGESGDAPPATELVPVATVEHLDELAREPMLVEAGPDTLWLSGYGAERPTLWRSTDGGASWAEVDVGTPEDGAVGNSDVDLAVGPDGTLYFAVMSYDREVLEGRAIRMAVSRDGGATWSWTVLSEDRFDDRPWVVVDSDGAAHAVWNDGGGVSHAVSRDRGATWEERPRIHDLGGSSHMAAGPDGRLAVRVVPLSASGNRYDAGVDFVAVSTDRGATWTRRELPGERAWSETFGADGAPLRWVEPVAWDGAGGLWALWTEGSVLRLARSPDDGATWESWAVVEGDEPVYFPYMVAGEDGRLAMSWFSGTGDALRANVALVEAPEAGGEGGPRVVRADPFAFPAFRAAAAPDGDEEAAGEPRLVRDTAGEYLPVVFLSDGRLAAATTVQDPAEERFGFTFRAWEIR